MSINVHKTPVECFEYTMASWTSEGVQGAKTPLDFEIKKGHFLSFEWVNANRTSGNTTTIHCIDILMLENR